MLGVSRQRLDNSITVGSFGLQKSVVSNRKLLV